MLPLSQENTISEFVNVLSLITALFAGDVSCGTDGDVVSTTRLLYVKGELDSVLNEKTFLNTLLLIIN